MRYLYKNLKLSLKKLFLWMGRNVTRKWCCYSRQYFQIITRNISTMTWSSGYQHEWNVTTNMTLIMLDFRWCCFVEGEFIQVWLWACLYLLVLRNNLLFSYNSTFRQKCLLWQSIQVYKVHYKNNTYTTNYVWLIIPWWLCIHCSHQET